VKGYTTSEVAQILGLSAGQVRRSVTSGLVEAERRPGGALRFSFQDVVFLKAARGLFASRLPTRRVRGALQKLREQIPAGSRMSGFQITVDGKRIVATNGDERWQPESGQILFDFGAGDLARRVAPLARKPFHTDTREPVAPLEAQEWYERGCDLEADAPQEAREAYRRALALDPSHPDANVNLGRLLHEGGDPSAAQEHYRMALARRPEDAIALFNLGVALEDLGREGDALAAYEKAVSLDPHNADAHYNAANLCERLGLPADALRHLKEYRALTRPGPR
jgi:tetratricopeptide (TPR) repeat protein